MNQGKMKYPSWKMKYPSQTLALTYLTIELATKQEKLMRSFETFNLSVKWFGLWQDLRHPFLENKTWHAHLCLYLQVYSHIRRRILRTYVGIRNSTF